ncbi:MAG: YcaO-like family protein [Deltaproteobacteria bacterium]|nr:YcaO-like family protein [Deltaproteobacteria bacterium]
MARINIRDLPSQASTGRFPQKTGAVTLRSRSYTFRENGHRIVNPKQTIQRMRTVLRRNRIRFSFQRVRPEARNRLDKHFFVHKVSSDCLYDNFGKDYALGKGLTSEQSVVSGLCELIERFSALLRPEDQFLRASTHEIEKQGRPILHPRLMGLPGPDLIARKKLDPFDEGRSIDWTAGWHLIHHKPALVPTGFSHLFPYNADGAPNRLVENRPNGLAAGNCLEEAILQGILELVERDAQAIFIWNQLPMPEIDPATLPRKKNPALLQALMAVQASGLKLILKDITSDIGIPTIYAFGIDESEKGPAFQWGVGAHLEPAIAVSRALTELIQVRTILTRFKKAMPRNIEEHYSQRWLLDHEEAFRTLRFCHLDAWESVRYITRARQTISLKEMDDLSHQDLLAEIRCCLERITAAGLTDVIVVNHTRAGLDFPVVRILIPGMEFIPWVDYDIQNPAGRRLAIVPPALHYRPSIDYVFGSGRESNLLL